MERKGPATSRTSVGVGGLPEVPIPEAAASWPAVLLGHLELIFQGVCNAWEGSDWKKHLIYQQKAQYLMVLKNTCKGRKGKEDSPRPTEKLIHVQLPSLYSLADALWGTLASTWKPINWSP